MTSENWVKHPIELKGKQLRLVPLDRQHFEELFELSKEPSIWIFSPTGVNGSDVEKHLAFLESCIEKRTAGEFYPFVIVLQESHKIVGFTMFHSIKPENKSLEIGCTWFHPQYWSSGINTECKYLMLTFCFEVLGTIRVQIKSSDTNVRSRKAIEKIGGKFEGILRKDKILEDGTLRNAAYYSIIDDDWISTKLNLEKLM
jgi:RimJ/RimL family protein N-acetyltransferase